MTASQRYTKLQNKTVSKEGRKRISLDKNDLTNIYRHNRSLKTLFLEFYFFSFLKVPLDLKTDLHSRLIVKGRTTLFIL